MIVKIGDIFESEAKTLVNTVNCVGVMGKGIALEFKKNTPICFPNMLLCATAVKLSPAYRIVIKTCVVYLSLTSRPKIIGVHLQSSLMSFRD